MELCALVIAFSLVSLEHPLYMQITWNFLYLETDCGEVQGIQSNMLWTPSSLFVASHISSTLCLSILLQERSDLLGRSNRGWWLHSTATIRRFCYESSARWLLWDTAVQDFCVHWWAHLCGRGELLHFYSSPHCCIWLVSTPSHLGGSLVLFLAQR